MPILLLWIDLERECDLLLLWIDLERECDLFLQGAETPESLGPW